MRPNPRLGVHIRPARRGWAVQVQLLGVPRPRPGLHGRDLDVLHLRPVLLRQRCAQQDRARWPRHSEPIWPSAPPLPATAAAAVVTVRHHCRRPLPASTSLQVWEVEDVLTALGGRPCWNFSQYDEFNVQNANAYC